MHPMQQTRTIANLTRTIGLKAQFSRSLTVSARTSTSATTTATPPAPPKQPRKSIILSGIQPTGQPHLGNYLGAITNWVKLQEEAHAAQAQVLYMVVDLHALTLPQDPKKLRREKKEMAITLLACGIDPKKCILFEQSRVPQHAELTWILNCMTPVGWLARMTQWKSKMGVSKGAQSIEDVNATQGLQLGLFSYPVLMAADILLYGANKVPVGEDQIQHLELTRDIGDLFNKNVKKKFFTLPQPIITETKRVMSLRDASSKMSKSDISDQTRINLVDSPKLIASKIKRAVTDSEPGITFDRVNRPAVANLVSILAAMQNTSVEEVVCIHANSTHSQFKEALTEGLITGLVPIQQEMARLENESGYVEQVLDQGAIQAQEIAAKNLRKVYELVGLR